MTRELETYEMIKELSKNPNKEFKNNKCDNNVKMKDGILCWQDGEPFTLNIKGFEAGSKGTTAGTLEEYRWTEIQESVDFMTAVTSGKYVRVEHPIVDKMARESIFSEDGKFQQSKLIENNKGRYDRLDCLLHAIAYFSCGNIQEVISEGNWYIEE